ncbi:hypothetical protein K469DRAFT_577893, partial [Zopfia rhizophila CBS 207.26]
FSLTKDFTINKVISPYIILSHTWRLNIKEEITFKELINSTSKNKPNYKKILFYRE